MVLGDLDKDESSDDITKLENMRYQIANIGIDEEIKLTLELLDPHGHSMIIDKNAQERDLTEEELESLPVGPDPAVFSNSD
jgi:C4-type Zn-finger protein